MRVKEEKICVKVNDLFQSLFRSNEREKKRSAMLEGQEVTEKQSMKDFGNNGQGYLLFS